MAVRYSILHEPPMGARWFEPTTFTKAVEAVRNGTADGMTVDVVNSDCTEFVSYEIVPGRQTEVYHNEEVWWWY